jgi:REase_MTES_1575
MRNKDTFNVLVAMLPERKDWAILHEQLWYRIRKLSSTPDMIKNGFAEYIAFYHTAKFTSDLKFKVVKYAKIKRIITTSRRQLFPEESPSHPKANQLYYKIEFDELLTLPQPIVSRRGHRITFVPTTKEKFFSGITDFNRLFKGSFLEEDMELIMDEWGIEYEREYREFVDNKKFYDLDFAIFCKNGKIDIECDGDTYHMGNENVHRDKTRNNELESYEWSVLRYTTKHFNEEREHIKKTIYKKIEAFGGAIKAAEPGIAYYPKVNPYGQTSLF